jgi:nucleotide-binding universal stress UspA family protein
MFIKTVLSVLGVDSFNEDLRGAIDFCQTHHAHLTAMPIFMASEPPIGSYQAVSSVWIEERQRATDRLAEKAAEIKAVLSRSDLSYEVQEIFTEFAWADIDIAERALYADLVLIGPQATIDKELQRRVVNGALFRTPTPMMIIPKGQPIEAHPKTILVAWDSTEEAARALRQSMDFLQGAESVHVTLVDPIASSSANGEEPGADVATFLARHGVKVDVDCISSEGRSIDEALRQHAVGVAADMIVMGAYNHPRLQERLFGGVTRSMLQNTPLPLFLAH